MVGHDYIITWSDGSTTIRGLPPRSIFIQGSTTLKEDAKDLVEREYGERPADIWVCLHRCAVNLPDQSDRALKDNCNHFTEFAKAGMIRGVSASSRNPKVPQRFEHTNPSTIHRS